MVVVQLEAAIAAQYLAVDPVVAALRRNQLQLYAAGHCERDIAARSLPWPDLELMAAELEELHDAKPIGKLRARLIEIVGDIRDLPESATEQAASHGSAFLEWELSSP